MLLPALPAFAGTITLSATCSLANAIRAANEEAQVTPMNSCTGATAGAGATGADTIELVANVSLGEDLPFITRDVTIDGNGFTINGSDNHRAFNFTTGGVTAEIKDITLTNMQSPPDTGGGAINVGPASGTVTLTLNNVTVHDNESTHMNSDEAGGGLVCSNAAVTINNSQFYNNRGSAGGGIAKQAGCSLTISGSAIYNNTAKTDGGGLHLVGNSGSVLVVNSSIYGNTTGTGNRGGGVYNQIPNALPVTFNHVTITNNSAPGVAGNRGGGIATGGTALVVVRNSIVYGNSNGDCAQTTALTINTGNIWGAASNCGAGTNAVSGDPLLADSATDLENGTPPYFVIPYSSPAVDAVDCLSSSTPGYNIDQRGQARPVGAKCDVGAFEVFVINLVSGTCSLPDAITAANSDMATNGCPAGDGDDVISLDADVSLAADLPAVTSNITFEGKGYTIDGVDMHRAFNFTVGGITVVIQDLTLTQMQAPASMQGGAIDSTPGSGSVDLTLSNVTVRDSSAWYTSNAHEGGALACASTNLTINDSQFFNNRGEAGGGIHIGSQCTATISGSAIYNNTAQTDGGGIHALGSGANVTVVNSSIYGNTTGSEEHGGGVYIRNAGTIHLNHVTITDNSSPGGESNRGGGIAKRGSGLLYVRNSIVYGNTNGDCVTTSLLVTNTGNIWGKANNCGASISDEDPLLPESATGSPPYLAIPFNSPAVDAVNCLSSSVAGYNIDQRGQARPVGAKCDAGAIELFIINLVAGTCSLADAITAANTDTATGGCPAGDGDDTIALDADVTLTADLPVVTTNIGFKGNGYTIDGVNMHRAFDFTQGGITVVLQDLTLTQMQSPVGQTGGAIDSSPSSGGRVNLELNTVTVRDSSAWYAGTDREGGALNCTWSNLTINDSRFFDNRANEGGGIRLGSNCTATINRSAIYNNTARLDGGGIRVSSGLADVTINNSSIYGNTSGSGREGGGINIAGGGLVRLNHVTITGNTAQGNAANLGGGIGSEHSGNRLHVRNSIVYGNTLGDCYQQAALLTNTGNIWGDVSNCGPGTNGVDGDPLLSVSPGSRYVGLTPDSPAIDGVDCLAATIAGYNEDQRGHPRPYGDNCDVGAIEVSPTEVNADCTLPDAITAANTDTATGGCPAGAGHDVIVLAEDSAISLSADLPAVTSDITFEGNGSTIDGVDMHRAFDFTVGGITVVVKDLTLTQNQAPASMQGGAIDSTPGSGIVDLTLSKVTVRDSSAWYTSNAYAGGGLACASTKLTVSDSSFYNNRGDAGGALRLAENCAATINRSAIYDNQSNQYGGGILIENGAEATINNSSIFGNSSGANGSDGRGGGIFVRSHATDDSNAKPLRLNHVTITDNSNTDADAPNTHAAGLASEHAHTIVHARNSIVYGNTGADDCYLVAALESNSGNFFGAGNCSKETDDSTEIDIPDRDPLLPESASGNPPYFALPLASPAVDFTRCLEADAGGDEDQRGMPRPWPANYLCDAGAYEYIPDIVVDENCSFTDAWTAAWTDTATGGCPAGDGDDVIYLTGDVTLGAKISQGDDGMGKLTIEGNRYAIRGDGSFGLFELSGGPTISFNNIVFTGGAAANNENGGAFNAPGGSGVYAFNDCVFYINAALIDDPSNTGGNGGAIAAGATTNIAINRCAFYNNRAGKDGGAIHTAGVITVNNSSFYDNSAAGKGGAISTQIATATNMRFRHLTITNNSSGENNGALQFQRASTAHVVNSIVYGNRPADCVRETDATNDTPFVLGMNTGNIIGESNCDAGGENTANTDNPRLRGPFGGYFLPRAGGPAIDAVDCLPANEGGNIDQRGTSRPLGVNCDIGAIEDVGFVPPPPPSADDEDEDEEAEAAASVAEIRDCPAPPGSPRRFGHIGSGDWRGNFARLGIQARNAAKQAEWAAGAASVSGMNRCLWDLECSTDGHWAYGHYLATHGHSYGAPGSQPPAAFGRAGGKYNLCYSVWNCNSAEAWDFGFESGKQIYDGFLILRGVPQC